MSYFIKTNKLYIKNHMVCIYVRHIETKLILFFWFRGINGVYLTQICFCEVCLMRVVYSRGCCGRLHIADDCHNTKCCTSWNVSNTDWSENCASVACRCVRGVSGSDLVQRWALDEVDGRLALFALQTQHVVGVTPAQNSWPLYVRAVHAPYTWGTRGKHFICTVRGFSTTARSLHSHFLWYYGNCVHSCR